MVSRVTQSTMLRDLVSAVNRLERRLGTVEGQLTSGHRLREPSDDPTGAARLTRVRSELADLESLREGASLGVTSLSAQDAALEQALAITTRAREIATQLSSDTITPEARQQAALEVAELERGLLTLGNTAVAGRHVFGSMARGNPPFAQLDDPGFTPATAYSGPSDPFTLRTGPDQAMTRITTPGDQVFGSTIQALDDLRVTLEAGSSPAANLDAIEAAAEDIRGERASIGGRSRRLGDRMQEILTSVQRSKEVAGDIQDADFVELAIELSQLQTALSAALESSNVLQTSILDHLRL